MELLAFPPELIQLICEKLDHDSDINSLCRVNRFLHGLLDSYLYRHHAQRSECSALKQFIEEGNVPKVQRFLDAGADLNAVSSRHRYNPLLLAAVSNHDALVNLFWEKGLRLMPDLRKRGFFWHPSNVHWGHTYLEYHHAIDTYQKAKYETSSVLLSRLRQSLPSIPSMPPPPPNRPQVHPLAPSYPELQNLLYMAVYFGHDLVLRLLIKERALKAFRQEECRETLLGCAARRNRLSTVKILVEAGLNIESENFRDGTTPLLYALKWGTHCIARYLVSVGANLEARCVHGKTALCYALGTRRSRTAKILIEKGADINPPMPHGKEFYPLFLASQYFKPSLANILMSRLDYFEIATTPGEKVALLRIATNLGRTDLAQKLLDHACGLSDEFTYREEMMPSKTVSAMNIALDSGKVDIVKLFLSRGASPSSAEANDPDLEPIMRAARWGRTAVVKVLLEAGADPNYRGLLCRSIQFESVFNLLLEWGAGPLGAPLLRSTIHMGHAEQLRALLERGSEFGSCYVSSEKNNLYLLPLVSTKHNICRENMPLGPRIRIEDIQNPFVPLPPLPPRILESDIIARPPYKRDPRRSLTLNTCENDMVDVLLEYGLDMEPGSRDDEAILSRAIALGHVELLKKLLNEGFSVKPVHLEEAISAQDSHEDPDQKYPGVIIDLLRNCVVDA